MSATMKRSRKASRSRSSAVAAVRSRLTADDLKRTLQTLTDLTDLTVVVHAEAWDLYATVTSPSFAGMDEGDRQELVWRLLLREFSLEALVAVKFIFTDAPGDEDDEEFAEDEAVA